MRALFNFLVAEFSKAPSPKPARIPPLTPPAGGKSAETKRKILPLRKKDFRFVESALKPHAWHIIYFGNRFELGTINTPEKTSRRHILPVFRISAILFGMSPEDRKLLEKTYNLAKENNGMLTSMRRAQLIGRFVRVAYWLIIIGIGSFALKALQPSLEKLQGLAGGASTNYSALIQQFTK